MGRPVLYGHPPGRPAAGPWPRILQALLDEGAAREVAGYWLLVTAANHSARRLYSDAGFVEAGRYLYRQDRPKRQLTGC